VPWLKKTIYQLVVVRQSGRGCRHDGHGAYPDENDVPAFDREKYVHCGACPWNCSPANPKISEPMNIAFRAGTSGLPSAEN
jgi:hypothetical protein